MKLSTLFNLTKEVDIDRNYKKVINYMLPDEELVIQHVIYKHSPYRDYTYIETGEGYVKHTLTYYDHRIHNDILLRRTEYLDSRRKEAQF